MSGTLTPPPRSITRATDARRQPEQAPSGQVPPTPRTTRRLDAIIRPALLVLVGVLVAAGAVAVAASFLPFAFAQLQLAHFGGMRGSASQVLTEPLFQSMVARARTGAAVLFAGATALFLGQRFVHAHLGVTLGDLPTLSTDILARARVFVDGAERIHALALVFIAVCGGLLRFAFLFQPIRYDEANTFLGSASVPLYIGLSKYLNNNNHLLNTLLMHVSFGLFGDSVWAIRLPAFFAGVLVVPAAYFAIRSLYGKQVALVTAGLVASSSTLVEYSTNGRGYTLLCCIWLLLLWFAVYALRTCRPAGFLVIGLLGGLGFYAMPIMLYPFGIVMLWLALLAVWPGGNESERPRVHDLAIAVVVAGLTTLVLYSPVFVVSGVAAVVANEDLAPWRTTSSLDVFARLPGSLATTWGLWSRDVPVVLQAVLGLGFLTSVIFARRLSPVRVPLIVAVVVWLLAVLLVQRVVPYERVWLFLLPLYLGMAVAGLGVLMSRVAAPVARYAPYIAIALAVLAVLVLGGIALRTRSIYYSEETGTLRDAEGITILLRERLLPGDKVLATETSQAPLYYYFRRWGVSFDYFAGQEPELQGLHGRLMVVVNESATRHQTLDVVLSQAGLRTAGGATGSVLQQYDTATVYELGPDELQPTPGA